MHRAETWKGGKVPSGQLFEATYPKVKGHPKVNLLGKSPMATKFGRKSS